VSTDIPYDLKIEAGKDVEKAVEQIKGMLERHSFASGDLDS
jgi:hypothetical protein